MQIPILLGDTSTPKDREAAFLSSVRFDNLVVVPDPTVMAAAVDVDPVVVAVGAMVVVVVVAATTVVVVVVGTMVVVVVVASIAGGSVCT